MVFLQISKNHLCLQALVLVYRKSIIGKCIGCCESRAGKGCYASRALRYLSYSAGGHVAPVYHTYTYTQPREHVPPVYSASYNSSNTTSIQVYQTCILRQYIMHQYTVLHIAHDTNYTRKTNPGVRHVRPNIAHLSAHSTFSISAHCKGSEH